MEGREPLSTWLTAWRTREKREPTVPVMELLVVAGADAGSQFTLEGNEVLLGRGQPASGQIDVIRLDDKSISRKQAWIRRDASGTSIEHIRTAANPTLVNGAEISRARLSVGDPLPRRPFPEARGRARRRLNEKRRRTRCDAVSSVAGDRFPMRLRARPRSCDQTPPSFSW